MFGGTKVKTKKGKTITLLNPAQRGKKYATELKDGFRYTNGGKLVTDEDGPLPLTKIQRSYRSGYLAARKDNANAYKHSKSKSTTKKTRSRKK